MTTATQLLAKIEKIDVLLSAQVAMEETASDATMAQRTQLSQGLRADGSLQNDYSPVSVAKYGKPPGPIKLFDTGAYYRGIILDVQGDKFSIFSTDEKDEFLEIKYNGLGLGLNAKTSWIVTLEPAFIGEIKKYLQ